MYNLDIDLFKNTNSFFSNTGDMLERLLKGISDDSSVEGGLDILLENDTLSKYCGGLLFSSKAYREFIHVNDGICRFLSNLSTSDDLCFKQIIEFKKQNRIFYSKDNNIDSSTHRTLCNGSYSGYSDWYSLVLFFVLSKIKENLHNYLTFEGDTNV